MMINSKDQTDSTTKEHRCNAHAAGPVRRFFMRRMHKRRTAWKQRRLSKVGQQLDLQEPQQEQLESIFNSWGDLKNTAMTERGAAINSFAEAIQGPQFDVEAFKAHSEENIQQMRTQLHRSIDTAAVWFDQLSEHQQTELRVLLQQRLAQRSA